MKRNENQNQKLSQVQKKNGVVKKERATKGVYFKTPKAVSKPKKQGTGTVKRVVKRVVKHTLHWGGAIDLPHGTINIYNTGAVDNMLVFVNKLLDLDYVYRWLMANASIRSCRILTAVKLLFDAGNLIVGRALWLPQYYMLSTRRYLNILRYIW